jgi:hypothetical protein
MASTIEQKEMVDQAGIEISEARLRGRQSVRTTFRLPGYLIELLGIIAEQFGVKQKSLFDQLIENSEVLNEVAECVAAYTPEKSGRRAKTYVLSKQSLFVLERVASERRISRDILVEVSIKRLLPLLLAEREKHFKRAKLLGEMEKYLQYGHELLVQTENLLGKADPVYEMVSRMVRLGEEKMMALQDLVARGKALEGVGIEKFSGDAANGGRV